MRTNTQTMTEQSNINFAAMNDDQLQNALNAIKAQMAFRKQEAITTAMRTFVEAMNRYGVSKADSLSGLDNGWLSWSNQEVTVEPIKKPEEEPVEAPVENKEKPQTGTAEEEKTSGNIFDNPAFKAPINPVAVRNIKGGEPMETSPVSPASEEEEDIPPMNELINGLYNERHTTKIGKKKDLSMRVLLSGKPINQIQLMGNQLAKGESFRQHSRLSHVDGVIPTETATGRTKIYIPE